MAPDTFQARVEGPWERWLKGGVDPTTLNLKVNIDQQYCYINGTVVYALAFPTLKENAKRIWNCQTGWQQKGML